VSVCWLRLTSAVIVGLLAWLGTRVCQKSAHSAGLECTDAGVVMLQLATDNALTAGLVQEAGEAQRDGSLAQEVCHWLGGLAGRVSGCLDGWLDGWVSGWLAGRCFVKVAAAKGAHTHAAELMWYEHGEEAMGHRWTYMLVCLIILSHAVVPANRRPNSRSFCPFH
jgi:hypothetical protein